MVDSVTSANSATVTQSSADRSKLATDMNTFLTLLTSQLKNQDPLSPMDSTEFTNQLVQFAQVEQQINMNSNMEDMLGVLSNSSAAQAVSYLDKYVEVESSYASLQDGNSVFTYGLEGKADTVTVALYDSKDKLVRAFTGETATGLHKISWDGKDSYGEQLEDGAYKITITATSKENGEVKTYSTALGKVTGVASDGSGGTLLGLGAMSADLTKVLGVFNTLPVDENTTEITDGSSTDETSTDESTTDDTTGGDTSNDTGTDTTSQDETTTT
ncbi:MAG: flagellar hook assembly protein FlgD [Rhodospirillum sp.]|nr:flagellar hook assembly protein FlgD [Rhodospirillum sp.]MCF8488774.1 flagellar hook assembly protein FlgD [Rhodospirillum sp.]MCF8499726.1 flagellar hook assembly protein FlgD [Rhodospirillum sp.]